jgi:hypothetical protein
VTDFLFSGSKVEVQLKGPTTDQKIVESKELDRRPLDGFTVASKSASHKVPGILNPSSSEERKKKGKKKNKGVKETISILFFKSIKLYRNCPNFGKYLTIIIGKSSFDNLVGSSHGIHTESDGKTSVVGLDQVRLIESTT